MHTSIKNLGKPSFREIAGALGINMSRYAYYMPLLYIPSLLPGIFIPHELMSFFHKLSMR
jgi:hypothetical protein